MIELIPRPWSASNMRFDVPRHGARALPEEIVASRKPCSGENRTLDVNSEGASRSAATADGNGPYARQSRHSGRYSSSREAAASNIYVDARGCALVLIT